jgi:tripartite-type tricarboxylate transporter receptor subunit TctC
VRIVVPFAPGGGADLTARLVQGGLSERLGQPIVIDNRPASSGVIGAEIVAQASPDGHTMLLMTSTHAASPAIYKRLPYDVLKDFAPVTLAVNSPLAVVVHPSVPAKSMAELLTYAKSHPNTLNYGSSGRGGPPHLAGEQLKSMAKIEIAHVPYKGIGPALAAVLGNEVQLTFSNLMTMQSHVKAGRVRALAVTSLQRSQAVPDLPTVAESGLPGYEAGAWYSFVVPSATPRAAVQRLGNELRAILHMPEVRRGVLAQGADVVGSSPEEFAKWLRANMAKQAKVIRDAGIVPE